jgi:twitching motility protein PilT
VLSTLHTLDAAETINRIITVFPPYQQKQVRMQLASVIKAIVSQRLVARADGTGRVPAVEVMLGTLSVREAIIDDAKTRQIPTLISTGHLHYGMQTFDQSLLMLYKKGLITYEEALLTASNPDDFALKVKGVQSTSDLVMEEDDRKRAGGKPAGGPVQRPPATSPAKPSPQGEAKEYKVPSTDSEFKIDRFGDK